MQFLARRFAEILQGIEALPAPRELPEIGDRPVGPVIGVDDRAHDDVRARCRFVHAQGAHTADHGVEINDLRHLRLAVDDRVAIGLGRSDNEVPDQIFAARLECSRGRVRWAPYLA